jgi:tetratricopeptide (TPR) repeat protein
MTRCLWHLGLVLVSCLVVSSLYSQTPDAKAELNLGIAFYEKGAYPEAVRHLERAVSLDPGVTIGHFYLASAYDWMCASPNPCDPHWSGGAIQEYSRVLELDPFHKEALKNLAHLFYRLARPEEAEGLYRKAAKLDANDPEALYAIAVLNWRRTYRVLMEERARLRLAPSKPLIGYPSCHEIRTKILADVEEGIALLTRTLQFVNYVDAQAYMAVFYMERAELQCGDRSAYKRDLRSEKQWWNRACVTYNEPGESPNPRMWRWPPAPPPPPPKRGDTCTWSHRK